jgi:hydrogenase-4 component F
MHQASDFDAIGPGTLARAPIATTLLLMAAVFVTGSPPFSLFFSEMLILKAGFDGAHPRAAAAFLAALVVLFCGFAYQIGRLALGRAEGAHASDVNRESLDLGMAVTLAAAVIAVATTVYMPAPLLALVRAATAVVAGHAG